VAEVVVAALAEAAQDVAAALDAAADEEEDEVALEVVLVVVLEVDAALTKDLRLKWLRWANFFIRVRAS